MTKLTCGVLTEIPVSIAKSSYGNMDQMYLSNNAVIVM